MEDATKKLIDEGLIIEAGWIGFKIIVISPNANETQLHDMRGAFFAGAMHLFSSIIVVLDVDSEPTKDDLRRMDLIHKELENYMKTMKERMQ